MITDIYLICESQWDKANKLNKDNSNVFQLVLSSVEFQSVSHSF